MSWSRVFSLRLVQWLGDVSYSLYPRHWPLVVLLPFALGHQLSVLERVLILPASLLLAGASKVLVEDVFRADRAHPTARRGPRSWRLSGRQALVSCAASVALVSAGSGLAAHAAQSDSSAAKVALAVAVAAPDPCFGAASALGAGLGCPAGGATGPMFPDPVVAESDSFPDSALGKSCVAQGHARTSTPCRLSAQAPGTRRVALVGDSHAAQWVPALQAIADQRGWSLDVYTKSSCPLTTVPPNATERYGSACAAWNVDVLRQLAAGSYDEVVVSGLSGQNYPHEAGETSLSAAARGLAAAWTRMRASGARVTALRDNPSPNQAGISDTPTCLASHAAHAACGTARSRAVRTDPQVTAGADTGVPVVDLTDLFCDPERCPAVIGRVLVYRGLQHFTAT